MSLLDQMIYADLQITRIAVVLGCIPSQLEMNYVQFSNTLLQRLVVYVLMLAK